jgi:hypothetical protein
LHVVSNLAMDIYARQNKKLEILCLAGLAAWHARLKISRVHHGLGRGDAVVLRARSRSFPAVNAARKVTHAAE